MKQKNVLASAAYAIETLVLYGFSVKLPFFYDDLPIVSWLTDRSWIDILQHPEAGYFRPLPYLIYKLSLAFPLGARQSVAHAANLVLLFLGAILIHSVVARLTEDTQHAALAGALYIAYPFLATTVPWITAMPHLLVTLITLLAVTCALRAAVDHKPGWYAASLAAVFLAPFAHESGAAAGPIVAGALLLPQRDRARALAALAAVALSAAAIGVRPATSSTPLLQAMDLSDPFGKTTFFLQGLLYPLMPLVTWGVRATGLKDLALIALSGGTCAVASALLIRAQRATGRWLSPALWWWAWGSLPAALFFNFAALYVAPRLYALGAVGAVVIWAGFIVALGRAWRRRIGLALQILLCAAIVLPGLSHIADQRKLFLWMRDLYAEVLEVVEEPRNQPVGLVNLPHNLAWETDIYPLIRDNVVFVPWYSDIGEFVSVNRQIPPGDIETVVYGPVLKDEEPFIGVEGVWLDVEQMAAFARDRATLWQTQRDARRGLLLREAGSIALALPDAPATALVSYTGGPEILTATVESASSGVWKLTFWWKSSGPLGAEIFVHVYDANGALITQSDGPALSGLAPIWIWQPGEIIRDVRYVEIPDNSLPPFSIGVGIYTGEGRFPAASNGQRWASDSAIVATIPWR